MKTNFGISASEAKKIAKGLYRALANNYALYFLTLHAHWNLKDSRFLFLHKMLEEQYEALAESGDQFAERIRIMGYPVDGSIHSLAKVSTFKDHASKSSADKMLAHLADCHEQTFALLRELSQLGEEAKDYGLVDMLGEKIQEHEKTAWFLRSHLK